MEITERNFVEQINQKNENALEYVIDEYGWLIKSITRKHLYCLKGYQEDCINEILLAIWDNISSFDEKRNTFQNWIAAISRYKAIDFKRKYLKDLKNENIDTVEIENDFIIDSKILKQEISEEWESFLNCLKDKDKDIFMKLYVQEMNMQEISEQTGLKKENIYNRISRGKTKLRKLFPLFLKKRGNKL